jgi:hypothetical protein
MPAAWGNVPRADFQLEGETHACQQRTGDEILGNKGPLGSQSTHLWSQVKGNMHYDESYVQTTWETAGQKAANESSR